VSDTKRGTLRQCVSCPALFTAKQPWNVRCRACREKALKLLLGNPDEPSPFKDRARKEEP